MLPQLRDQPGQKWPASVEVHGARQRKQNQLRTGKDDHPDQSQPVPSRGREQQYRYGEDERDPEPTTVIRHHVAMVVAHVRARSGGGPCPIVMEYRFISPSIWIVRMV